MNQTASPFDGLVDEEIRRLVAEAVANGSTISTSDCVARIKHVYPTCGLSDREISDRVITAASAAAIAVEFGAASELPD